MKTPTKWLHRRPRQYRGLTKDGKMVYGWYVKAAGDSYIIPTLYAEIVKDFDNYKVIPESVAQQVGLKDINKNEIYEGDIVKKIQDEDTPDNCKRYDGAIGQVVYSLWPFGEFQIDLIKGEKWSFYYPDDINFVADELEIIGNIHQNPELLEKPK